MRHLPLAGKVALVTGSTSGLGLAIARALATQGAGLALNGFGTADVLEKLCADISEKHGVRVVHFHADVGQPSEVATMMAAAHTEFGGIDILVNSAGVSHQAAIEVFAPEKWDTLLAVHLSAAFHTARLALPHMKARNWGRIINIASVYGLVAGVHQAAYVAAKHGLVGLTKVIALETAATGVTCNALCPGLVLTPPVEKRIETRMTEEGLSRDAVIAIMMATRQPSRQFMTPEQVAALALFLCSDAASEVRGAAWNMDGAWTAA